MSVHRSAASRPGSRRRSVIAGLLLLVLAVGYPLALHHADRERARLRASVEALAAQEHMLERRALEIERLREAPEPASSPSALREILQSEARAAGLAQDAVTLEAIGTDEVRLVMGSIEFAAWLRWVERLQAQHVRLESCHIEPLARPGLVHVTAAFVRGR